MKLVYGSVCSGIEAATMAWHPLGWTAKFFSEVEAFPSAVLAHHYGSNMPGEPLSKNGTPNYGDFTTIPADAGPVDLLVGGTPCQSFSVAGRCLGLDDPRGNLALEFLALARRLRARWIVWENVPGVLSSKSDGGGGSGTGDADGPDGDDDGSEGLTERDFATFLGFVQECGYGACWRVLDAQYVRVDEHAFATPQRRRRVFLVGHLGDWRPAAAVLFEREGCFRHPAPRREAGQGTAADAAPSLAGSGRGVERAGETRGQDPVVAERDVSATVSSKWAKGSGGPAGDEAGNLVAHALRGEGFDASEDGTGRGTPIVAEVAPTVLAGSAANGGHRPYGTDVDTADSLVASASTGYQGDRLVGRDGVWPAIPADGGNNGGGAGALLVDKAQGPVSFSACDDGRDAATDATATLRVGNGKRRGGGQQMAVAFHPRIGRNGRGAPQDVAFPLTAEAGTTGKGDSAQAVVQNWTVRRLTPRECERLQRFPDDFTRIPWRGKPAEDCPDSPRYKAIGNSMAVNVMAWIGRRIDLFETLRSSGDIPEQGEAG